LFAQEVTETCLI